MKKYIAFIATLLFFASVTVFTLPMMQDDASVDLFLTEKVTIMANAGDGGDGDEDAPDNCYWGYIESKRPEDNEWLFMDCDDCEWKFAVTKPYYPDNICS